MFFEQLTASAVPAQIQFVLLAESTADAIHSVGKSIVDPLWFGSITRVVHVVTHNTFATECCSNQRTVCSVHNWVRWSIPTYIYKK